MSRKDGPFPVFSVFYDIFAIPYNFLIGFVVGVVAPVAAIAAMVAGVRLLTGKVPFLTPEEDDEGEERLSISLVPEDRVGELFEEQKARIGGDLQKMRVEIKAIIEESKAGVERSAEADADSDIIEEPPAVGKTSTLSPSKSARSDAMSTFDVPRMIVAGQGRSHSTHQRGGAAVGKRPGASSRRSPSR